jgi:LDH2 family malate/lactate/ureidoglycolate dehydrogenase
VKQVFEAMGCSDYDANLASDVLIEADLRGIDSHGVARLSGYIRLWEAGRINIKPKIKVIREMPGTATIDGDAGLGLVVAPKAMQIAIEKAEIVGCGMISVSNSNHFGIAAYHAMMASDRDMIGIAMTNASPLVAPTYSAERMLGTNPMCFAIPAGKYPPFVADLATSAAANGKLEIAERKGKKIPSGWLQDGEGNDTRNPVDLKSGGALLPLGGNREMGSHKGYALSSVVDILSAVLSGANYGPWVPPFVSFLPLVANMHCKCLGHFVGAMNIEAFRDTDVFKRNVDQWIERFKNAKPSDERQKVIIPGEPEFEIKQQRTVLGIPLIENVVKDLEETGKRFGITLP